MPTLLLMALLTTVSANSSFALNLADLRGETRTEYMSPRGVQELCIVAKKWPGAVYRNDDAQKEGTLCGYDFYRTMGLCPKYTSTNPAILLLEPNAHFSKEAIDASNCDLDKMNVKTEAKFKQTITCSYTPAILAYYHMSRILGGVGRVPVTVMRTMDLQTHRALTQKALQTLRGFPNNNVQSWEKFGKVHEDPSKFPSLVEASQTQLFGALSDNVKKEEIYTEVSGIGPYPDRYPRFLKQKPFQKVASTLSVQKIVGSSDFVKVAQDVIQMKDVSDLVLIDTLLSQQDRIGNIHYKYFWYSINPLTNRLERMKSDAKLSNGKVLVPTEESRQMADRQAALLKEMVLKDNDCGVNRENMMRKHSALEKVNHMSYLTYQYFMAFEKTLNNTATKDYFSTELLYSSEDFQTLLSNAAKAKEILKEKCRSGKLRFDLDLENYIPEARPPATKCDI